jgi:serine/threonine-protein kinase
MARPELEIGGWTACAAADVPEAGVWHLADARHDAGRPVWLRFPKPAEDPRRAESAYERLKHLEHALIPKVVAWDRAQGALAVTAPAGVPLSRMLAVRGDDALALTPATVLDVAVSLSDMLVAAHERGRPHGHLSPSRIWVTPEGQLVVWGFGEGPDAPVEPRWVSPERARGRRASGDADQWALAAVVAGLITGRVPWSEQDADVEARMGDASHLHTPVTNQWSALGRILEKALASEPRERFPSAHPLRQAFVALQDRLRAASELHVIGTTLAERHGLPGGYAMLPASVSRMGRRGTDASESGEFELPPAAGSRLEGTASPLDHEPEPTVVPSVDGVIHDAAAVASPAGLFEGLAARPASSSRPTLRPPEAGFDDAEAAPTVAGEDPVRSERRRASDIPVDVEDPSEVATDPGDLRVVEQGWSPAMGAAPHDAAAFDAEGPTSPSGAYTASHDSVPALDGFDESPTSVTVVAGVDAVPAATRSVQAAPPPPPPPAASVRAAADDLPSFDEDDDRDEDPEDEMESVELPPLFRLPREASDWSDPVIIVPWLMAFTAGSALVRLFL